MTREPDRYDAQARTMLDTLSRGQWSEKDLIDAVADRLRAAESEALERAAHVFESERGPRLQSGYEAAALCRAMKPDPAAAPAAETDRCACGAENLLGVTSIRSADGKTHMRDSCAAGGHRIAPLQDVDPEGTWGARYLHELQGKQRAIPAPAQEAEARDGEWIAALNRFWQFCRCDQSTTPTLLEGIDPGCDACAPLRKLLAARAAPQSGEGR